MAWASATYYTGDLIDSAVMNQWRDNLNSLGGHNHGTGFGSGGGSSGIEPVTHVLLQTASGVTVPPAGLLRAFATESSGSLLGWRVSGSGTYHIANSTHTHTAL